MFFDKLFKELLLLLKFGWLIPVFICSYNKGLASFGAWFNNKLLILVLFGILLNLLRLLILFIFWRLCIFWACCWFFKSWILLIFNKFWMFWISLKFCKFCILLFVIPWKLFCRLYCKGIFWKLFWIGKDIWFWFWLFNNNNLLLISLISLLFKLFVFITLFRLLILLRFWIKLLKSLMLFKEFGFFK